MPREYVVVDLNREHVTYKGISRLKKADDLKQAAGFLCIAYFQGDADIWILDNNTTAVETLQQLFRDDYDHEPSSIHLFPLPSQ